MPYIVFNIETECDVMVGIVEWTAEMAARVTSRAALVKLAHASDSGVAELSFYDESFGLYESWDYDNFPLPADVDQWDFGKCVLVDQKPNVEDRLRLDMTRFLISADGDFWWEMMERHSDVSLETTMLSILELELFTRQEQAGEHEHQD